MINAHFKAVLLVVAGVLAGCKGGTDSQQDNTPPTANAGTDFSVRSHSEFVLSGRQSYDDDGPVMEYQWRQTGGPTLDASLLSAVNRSTVRVRLPDYLQDTSLEFELTVQDGNGATRSDRVTVNVIAVSDGNNFLQFLNTRRTYTVEAALADSAPAINNDLPFDLVMTTRVRYENLDGEQVTYTLDSATRSGTWTAAHQAQGLAPRFTFDLPAADLITRLDANPAKRDEVEVTIHVALASDPGVAYELRMLDANLEPIAPQLIAAAAARSPAGDELDISLNALLDQLGDSHVESLTTANAYYDAIDPERRKTTLQDWKTANGYDADAAVSARYINGFDLGFGRNMTVWKNASNHVFAMVQNHPTLEKTIEGTGVMATVAMEYSPAPEGGDSYTKFYTFVPDPATGQQVRVGSMDFDGRGEKFIPGNCAVCHGGRTSALDDNGRYPNNGNLGARFLPWDVGSFYFSDAAYEQRPVAEGEKTVSREAQEPAFKAFNRMILDTNLTDEQRELIHGWYGGDTLPQATFNDGFVPQGWKTPGHGGPAGNPDNSESLYTAVVAESCRACNTGRSDEDPELGFGSYEAFMSFSDQMRRVVYDEGVMPLARVTMDNFWVQRDGSLSPASRLATHLAINGIEQNPGKPTAEVKATTPTNGNTLILDTRNQTSATVERGTAVQLSATNSLFAAEYQWTLSVPPGSAATLTSVSEALSSFVPDRAGTFTATLSTTNRTGESVSRDIQFIVENKLPALADQADAIAADETSVIDILSLITVGDGLRSLHQITGISNIIGGTAQQTASGIITFTPSGSGSGSYRVTVADIDGDSVTATVNITISSLPLATLDAVNANVGTVSNARPLSIPFSDVLANDALGVTPTTVTGLSLVSRSLSTGLGSCSNTGAMSLGVNQFNYTPPVGCTGTETYRYTITDSNANTASADITLSVSATAEGNFSNVATAVSNKGCAGCHDEFHVLRLNGTALQQWTQIVECNNGQTPDALSDCSARGARVSLATPVLSVILRNPLDQLTPGHGGGNVFGNTSDADYLRVLRWIEEGARSP